LTGMLNPDGFLKAFKNAGMPTKSKEYKGLG
jgi:hypothetical protein